MQNILKLLSVFLTRLRYPFSTPEDIATDLGLNITNDLSFDELIFCITSPGHRPSKLSKYMPRDEAEILFQAARRKEIFRHNALFSYYFKGGWMEFLLQYDDESRLRRMYICHKTLKQKHEILID